MLQGCYLPRYAYSPAPNNVPVITEKKASKLGAYYSQNLSNHSRGFDAQGAIAFTGRWAIQGSYFFRKETNAGNDIRDSSTVKYKRSAFEAAIGYYVPLNEETKAWFQIFVGGWQGKTRLDDIIMLNNPVVSRYFVANVNKLYIQPAFLFTFNKHVS